MKYQIEFTDIAWEFLREISDRRIKQTIARRIDSLRDDPEKQGKPLAGKLAGFRSVHTAGRYRIIYGIERERIIVYVLAVGMRKEGDKKDIYNLAKKLLKLGLITPP
ncbi:MAG: type II toxin-antitoxin system RelE/ParE family toxin [Candidatus Eremiobacteraeota bacterium]|nr:type II toxin-antitoxin system RelE/ParE family toxin [Candidatus Eremiobacteraeota bacterium]